MRVEIDLEQAINNVSLRSWFFRQQAIDQYDELESVLKDEYDLAEKMCFGTNKDIQMALCKYIDDGNYNPTIKEYINSVNWRA